MNKTQLHKLLRKAASDAFPFGAEPGLARSGEHMSNVASQHLGILPHAGLGAGIGAGIGLLANDPVAGAGGGAGLVLGHGAGRIAGTGLGSALALGIAKATGIKDPHVIAKMMDSWGTGGGHLGRIAGSVYGLQKGVDLARGLSGDEQKTAAARTLEKMGGGSDTAVSLAKMKNIHRQNYNRDTGGGTPTMINPDNPFITAKKDVAAKAGKPKEFGAASPKPSVPSVPEQKVDPATNAEEFLPEREELGNIALAKQKPKVETPAVDAPAAADTPASGLKKDTAPPTNAGKKPVDSQADIATLSGNPAPQKNYPMVPAAAPKSPDIIEGSFTTAKPAPAKPMAPVPVVTSPPTATVPSVVGGAGAGGAVPPSPPPGSAGGVAIPPPGSTGGGWLDKLKGIKMPQMSRTGSLLTSGAGALATLGGLGLAGHYAGKGIRDYEDERENVKRKTDFLQQQQRMEMARQQAMLDRLRAPSLYGQ